MGKQPFVLAGCIALAIWLTAACNRAPVTPAPARTLAPTFTPAPAGVAAAVVAATPTVTAAPPLVDDTIVTADDNAGAVPPLEAQDLILNPTPSPTVASAPTTSPSISPAAQLAQAATHFRYGEYSQARTVVTQLLDGGGLDALARLDALYLLARLNLADDQPEQALSVLDTLLAEAAPAGDPGADLAAQGRFLRAKALSALGRHDQAIPEYWAFLERFPSMGESVQQEIGAAYLALGDNAAAAAAYQRAADALDAASDDTVAYVQILENLAAVHAGAARYGDAVAAYDGILAVAQNAGYRADIQYKAGQALATAGDLSGAVERWRAATAESPGATAAYAALIELVEREVDFDLYDRGYIDLLAGAWLPAINAYTAYLDIVDATDARAGLALLGIGQAYLGLENPVDAMPYFERVIAEYPACSCYGQAWLDLARAQALFGDANAARKTLRTFAREHAAD
ncbi:MAG: tetratricopeptide repeat protein, partial [Caldilineaceae bacterium]|nr:tetratricopeptide repeat protein [Caldilineaceae bacterium]